MLRILLFFAAALTLCPSLWADQPVVMAVGPDGKPMAVPSGVNPAQAAKGGKPEGKDKKSEDEGKDDKKEGKIGGPAGQH